MLDVFANDDNYAFIILFLACSATDYQCPIHGDGYRACIGGWEVCDGFTDCFHGADEYGCESESKCNNYDFCVY